MQLTQTFEAIRPSIVAFISRFAVTKPGEDEPLFPQIIGTGFFVDNNGIVATNRHVVDAIERMSETLPRHPESGRAPFGALVFTEIRAKASERLIGMLNVDLLGWKVLEDFTIDGPWFGEAVPDIGFVQLRVRENPTLVLATDPDTIVVGRSIATAGYPRGTETVTYHDRITQLTPVLRHGIVSSVFPFGVPKPHGFSIDALLQGGASGSPVFTTDTGEVLGIIASQITGTNFTVAVPSHLVAGALKSCKENWPVFADLPTLRELMEFGDLTDPSQLTWDHFVIAPPENPRAS